MSRTTAHRPETQAREHARPASTLCVRLGDLQPVFEIWCLKLGYSPADVLKQLVTAVGTEPQRFEHISHTAQDRVRISVGDVHTSFAQWCQIQDVAQSAAVRMLVATKLRSWVEGLTADQLLTEANADAHSNQTLPEVKVQVGIMDTIDESDRLRLRLSRSEMQSLKTLATARKVNASRLATQVVRAYMVQASLLSHQDEVDLGAMNLSLMRIGNNLNQIARRFNTNGVEVSQQINQDGLEAGFKAELSGCIKAIQDHVRDVAKVLDLSRQRWRIEVQG